MQVVSSIPGWGRDPLGEGMATHSSILAWRILWPEEPAGLLYRDIKEATHHAHTQDIVSKGQWLILFFALSTFGKVCLGLVEFGLLEKRGV